MGAPNNLCIADSVPGDSPCNHQRGTILAAILALFLPATDRDDKTRGVELSVGGAAAGEEIADWA
jgi:hypothetical protein